MSVRHQSSRQADKTELETRFDKRVNLIETRLDALNQNYINPYREMSKLNQNHIDHLNRHHS